MAQNKKSVIIYADYIHTFEELTDTQAGKLIKHFLRYVNDKNPKPPDKMTKIIFEPIKQQLKRDLQKWEAIRTKRAESGKIGGIKSGESRAIEANEANASKSKQNEANEAVNVNVTVNGNVIDNKANAFVVPRNDAAKREQKKKYDQLLKQLEGKEKVEIWNTLKTFVQEQKPDFPEPYVDAWNLFASSYQLSQVEIISDGRRKKFNTRCREPGFDFLRVLEKIKTSTMLKGNGNGGWKVTFDWVIENGENYLKILEGNYD